MVRLSPSSYCFASLKDQTFLPRTAYRTLCVRAAMKVEPHHTETVAEEAALRPDRPSPQ
jgi:hypothetical protein